MDYEMYELGEVRLQMGETLRDAKLAYRTYGSLNQAKSNAIVYPTWYSGQHYDNEWLIGEGMALDPARYCIIVPNMLGNGLSSSPSNTPPPYDRARFPHVTVYDNVSVQHRLVTERLGILREGHGDDGDGWRALPRGAAGLAPRRPHALPVTDLYYPGLQDPPPGHDGRNAGRGQ